jgi:hypothetical protein
LSLGSLDAEPLEDIAAVARGALLHGADLRELSSGLFS